MIVTASIALTLLIIGTVLTAFGVKCKQFYTAGLLFSVPLFSTQEDNYGWYIGITPQEPVAESVYSISELGDIDIEMTVLEIEDPEEEQTLYLLHNMWGYDIDITVMDARKDVYLKFSTQRNLDYDEIDSNIVSETIPSELMHHGYVFTRCPTNHTLITMEENVEPDCNNPGGYIMPIRHDLQRISLGKFTFNSCVPPIHFIFHKLRALPMNFVDTPQMYITSWKDKSTRTVLLSIGLTCAVIGLVMTVVVAWGIWSRY